MDLDCLYLCLYVRDSSAWCIKLPLSPSTEFTFNFDWGVYALNYSIHMWSSIIIMIKSVDYIKVYGRLFFGNESNEDH